MRGFGIYLLAFLSFAIVCGVAQGAEAQSRCSDLFTEDAEQAAQLYDRAIQDLAHLRLKLDLALAQGASAVHLSLLRPFNYPQNFAQFRYLNEFQLAF
jgi:hypothetical protein